MEDLYQALIRLDQSQRYPFHMPGHKRNLPDEAGFLATAAKIDITEIEGYDNLHHAEGLILKEEERIASVYGSRSSHILVGGSTAGVLSAICSQTRPGDTIVLDRGSHKSAYHAVILGGLKPAYIFRDEILRDFESFCESLPTSRPFTVFLTMPTYEGGCVDLKPIADAVHEKGGLLIVDGAHGAHLRFMKGFENIYEGADIVIQSLHKTLPALTQTAVIHVMSERVDEKRLSLYLTMLQTSSPSYVLMASVSHLFTMLKEQGTELFDAYQNRLKDFRERTRDLTHLAVNEASEDVSGRGQDPSKIVITVKDHLYKQGSKERYDGYALADELLKTYELDMEMATTSYALAMTSVMDTREGFDRLASALFAIDVTLEERAEDRAAGNNAAENIAREDREDAGAIGILPRQIMLPSEAVNRPKETVFAEDAAGRVSAEFIFFYPPGIPILVPGEEITKELADRITYLSGTTPNLIRSGQGFEVVV